MKALLSLLVITFLLISCESKSRKRVEVKPSVFINKDLFKEIAKKYSGVDCHLLILNDMPFVTGKDNTGLCFFGYGVQNFKYPIHDYFEEFYMKSINDFSSFCFLWDGMMFDNVERKDFLCFSDTKDFSVIMELQHLWIDAGNEFQFKVKGGYNV